MKEGTQYERVMKRRNHVYLERYSVFRVHQGNKVVGFHHLVMHINLNDGTLIGRRDWYEWFANLKPWKNGHETPLAEGKRGAFPANWEMPIDWRALTARFAKQGRIPLLTK